MSKKNWSRNESILALALYCKTPFSKISSRNDQIIELAHRINRTPSAVSMKMCNFARFDTELISKGISGLTNGSRLDGEIWNEFHQNMEQLYLEAEQISGSIKLTFLESDIEIPVGEEIESISKARKGQAFFRNAVLSAYNNTCCITGLKIPKLLQASHIKSWKDSDPLTERTNPANGLCLNALHHKAFDNGLFTIDTDYKILVSKQVKDVYASQVFNDFFKKYEGQQIIMPIRFLPSKEMIIYHNSKLVDF